MNDTWTERSTTGFDRAQAAYDRQEPKEYPECRVCDGTCRVEVASVFDVDGHERFWPVGRGEHVEVDCPFCEGIGHQQPDPDWEIQRRDSLADLPR